MNNRIKDITGQKFGRLYVLKFAYTKNRSAYWLCKCDCGAETIVRGDGLRSGAIKSCGCLQKEKAAQKCAKSAIDLTGMRFGKLTVQERCGSTNDQKAKFLCKCDCGNTAIVSGRNLRNGTTKSCGCIKHEIRVDCLGIIGKRFGRLVVEEYLGMDSRCNHKYRCLCDCGKEVNVALHSLLSGNSTSCGCKRDENFNGYKHGKSHTNIYDRWKNMKQRCCNPHNRRFNEYGGRGIKVCDEWLHNPVAFYDWAVDNGYSPELTLDRIDVDGNYEPTNCRWVDCEVQNNNTRRTRKVLIGNETLSLKQIARKYNIPYGQIIKSANEDVHKLFALIGRKNE